MEDVQAAMAAGEPMKCTRCKWGLVKPDIVFYGEELPARFEEVGWDGVGWVARPVDACLPACLRRRSCCIAASSACPCSHSPPPP